MKISSAIVLAIVLVGMVTNQSFCVYKNNIDVLRCAMAAGEVPCGKNKLVIALFKLDSVRWNLNCKHIRARRKKRQKRHKERYAHLKTALIIALSS